MSEEDCVVHLQPYFDILVTALETNKTVPKMEKEKKGRLDSKEKEKHKVKKVTLEQEVVKMMHW